MDSVTFLDAVRKQHGLDSDNKLATFLEIARPRVSAYRTGARKLDPNACHKVAAALDVPVEYVFAEIQAERAKRTEDRAAWRRLAALAKKSQAAALLVIAGCSGAWMTLADALATARQCILC